MSDLNKAMIIGRLGRDPEVKTLPSGQSVCNFSVATSRKYKNREGELVEATEWHRIVAWGKTAELCGQYLAKGRQCYVEGRLETRSYDDKDGNKKYSTEIVADTVQFLGSKGDGGGRASGGGDEPSFGGGGGSVDNDDIPFAMKWEV